MIDAVDVIRFVGPQAFGRARDLVRAGLVDEAVWHDDAGTVTATVSGSADDPYEVRVETTPARGDFVRPVRSTCSCPLGGECKHVAAALLTVNARALAAAAGPRVETPAPPPSDWRHDLARLAGDDEQAVATAGTPMGLQFELRDAVPARLASRARAAGRALPTASRSVRLGVRPVTRSGAGNWVRGQLTWSTLPYSANRLGLAAEQHAWFLQFAALHRAGQLAGLPGESDWIHLDDFGSPLLWPLLRQAPALGIAFVTGKREGGAVLGAEARVLLDAVRQDDGLVIGASAVLDGRPVPEGGARMIGDHGVYAFRESPSFHVSFAPTPTAVPADQRRMLVEGARITVPRAEVDEFLADWSPRLRGSLGLVSSDGSIELPERTPPELVLTATFEPARAPRTDDRVHLQWRWHVDGRKDPVALHGPLPDLSGLRAADDPRADGTSADGPDTDGPSADGSEPTTPAAEADDAGRAAPPGGPGGALAWFQDGTIEGADAAVFANELLPGLPALGVRTVVQCERTEHERLTGRPHIRVTTMPSEKHDWFDLGIIVSVNGREIPFTPLLRALAKRDRRMKLIDGSYLSLADPVFDRLKELIEEARELDEWEPDQPLTVTPFQAGLWSEFDQLADETAHDERWQAIASGLLGATPPGDTPVPDTVHAELRPYQHAGYAWLSFLLDHGIGGVLADDMGLGKTLQVLAAIAASRASSPDAPPVLVVAPTSVVGNWALEAERFTPSLRVTTVTATSLKDPARVARAAAASDVVVTSYALLRLDERAYSDLSWSVLVLDEAQFVKNPQSQTHRAAAGLRAPVKLAVTGTPLENGLTDLWALFHIVAPGLLSSWSRFGDDYVKPLSSPDLRGAARAELTARLRRRIRPLMLRRTKESVAADLPPKQEQIVRVTLDPAHRALYETTLNRERLKVLDLIDDLARNRMIVFRSLTLLRMLALSPTLVGMDGSAADPLADGPAGPPVPSAKLDLLLDELEQLAAEGRRALVFSQFTSFLRMVADALDARGVGYEYLDGSTRRRPEVIERFRSGTAPAFLISLKAGGFGLTLTEADTVFVLDPWWNPAAENQAVDRTHRIGQTRSVTVQRFIAEDTIEEKVLALAARKAELFATMIDDDALFADDLTADDIRSLLE